MGSQDNQRDRMRALVSRAWADPEFMSQLRADPKPHLKEAGILSEELASDPNYYVRTVESPQDIKDRFDFFLPPRPNTGGELTDDQFEKALDLLDVRVSQSPMTTCCCDITVAPQVF